MGGDWVMLDHDLSATSKLGIFDQHPIRQALYPLLNFASKLRPGLFLRRRATCTAGSKLCDVNCCWEMAPGEDEAGRLPFPFFFGVSLVFAAAFGEAFLGGFSPTTLLNCHLPERLINLLEGLASAESACKLLAVVHTRLCCTTCQRSCEMDPAGTAARLPVGVPRHRHPKLRAWGRDVLECIRNRAFEGVTRGCLLGAGDPLSFGQGWLPGYHAVSLGHGWKAWLPASPEDSGGSSKLPGATSASASSSAGGAAPPAWLASAI